MFNVYFDGLCSVVVVFYLPVFTNVFLICIIVLAKTKLLPGF